MRQQLPRIAALGTTVVWLWPPVMHREVGEEYAIVDFSSLDPAWGTPEKLRRLIDDAHGYQIEQVSTVYLTRSDDFADALAAGSLGDGPILLVPSCGDLPGVVEEEIQRLDPDRIVGLAGDDRYAPLRR